MGVKGLFKSKNLSTVAFFNILGPIILNGINFFTVPIFTRMLGTDNYGIFTVYSAWVNLFTVLVGFQTYGTISTASVHLEKDEQQKYISSIMSFSVATFIFLFSLVIVFLKPISDLMGLNRIMVVLILLQAFGMFGINFATAKFTYYKDAFKTFLISVAVSVIGVSSSIVMIYLIEDPGKRYWGRILGYAIPRILIGVLLIAIILFQGRTLFHKKYWKFCLPLCIPLVFHGLSHLVLSQSDKVMLQYFTTNAVVGIYGFAFTVANLLKVVWQALNNTWLPFYFEDLKEGKMEEIQKRTNNYLSLFAVLTIGFILLAPEMVRLFASADFYSSVTILPLMCAGMYIIFLYSFPVNFQFFHKRTASIALGTALSAVCNIVLNLLFIRWWGMLGATVATLISYFLLLLFHELMARVVVKEKYHYSFKMYLPGILAVTLCIVIYYLTIDMWYIRWPLAAVIGLYQLRRMIKNKSIF